MDEKKTRVPDWHVERLAQGELGADEARALEARLAAEEGGRARLDAIAASNREILERLPPATVATAIRARFDEARATGSRTRGGRGRTPLLWLGPLIAAGAVGLIFVAGPRHDGAQSTGTGRASDGDEVLISKGATKLLAFRASATEPGKSQPVADAAEVRPHDLIQLAYTAGDARFGVVLSVDARGTVTQHLPVGAATAAALSPAGITRLPISYELDDSPGFERFFFVTSDKAFPVSTAIDATRALARVPSDARHKPLALPANFAQESLLLQKVLP